MPAADPAPDPLTGEANLLGALAQVIADQIAAAAATAVGGSGSAAGGSGSAAAALSALHHFLDRPSIDDLRRVLGLTPSGAVRLVDRLAEGGLVARGPGADGRSRTVHLTPAGRDAAARVSAARAEVLGRALRDLSGADRHTLHELLGRVMAAVVRDKDGGAWICRLCDLRACGRDEGDCPTANAAAAKYGHHRPPPR